MCLSFCAPAGSRHGVMQVKRVVAKPIYWNMWNVGLDIRSKKGC